MQVPGKAPFISEQWVDGAWGESGQCRSSGSDDESHSVRHRLSDEPGAPCVWCRIGVHTGDRALPKLAPTLFFVSEFWG